MQEDFFEITKKHQLNGINHLYIERDAIFLPH